MKKYETISSDLKFRNPYWEYKVDRYVLPGGNIGEYHYVNSRGAGIIIPRLSDNTFVMVRQYRYLNNKVSIEFPGGGVPEGLSAIENAKKELIEEAGLEAGHIKAIGEYNPYNGVTNEICTVFLAEDLQKTEANPDETEEFEILTLSGKEINNKIINKEIWDGMSIAAWAFFHFSRI
ncbi:NUDIX domain-containing protein [Bacteroidota bacterium]